MKLIGEYENIDIAFLPIGNNFTMGIKDASIAASYINCKNIIGMHYDTFGYIKINKEDAIMHFSEANQELTFMEIGESKPL